MIQRRHNIVMMLLLLITINSYPTSRVANANASCLSNAPPGVLCICNDPKMATNDKCISQADVAQYRVYETNDAAGTMCRFFNLLSGNVARIIAAFVIVITGLGAYQGRLEVKTMAHIVIALSIIFSAPSAFTLVAPTFNIQSGCQCKTDTIVAQSLSGVKRADLGLHANCSERVKLTTST